MVWDQFSKDHLFAAAHGAPQEDLDIAQMNTRAARGWFMAQVLNLVAGGIFVSSMVYQPPATGNATFRGIVLTLILIISEVCLVYSGRNMYLYRVKVALASNSYPGQRKKLLWQYSSIFVTLLILVIVLSFSVYTFLYIHPNI